MVVMIHYPAIGCSVNHSFCFSIPFLVGKEKQAKSQF
jgi:hypothetical protein